MKKLFLLAIVLCACMVSCSKEVVYQSLILGKWKGEKYVTYLDGVEKDTSTDTAPFPGITLSFERDGVLKVSSTIDNSDGEPTQMEMSYSYSISGDILNMMGGVFKIISLTSTKMVLDPGINYNGTTAEMVFKKVN